MTENNVEINMETNDSIVGECTEYKRAYDICFNSWFYNKYLKGSNDLSECQKQYDRYTSCVERIINYKDPMYVRVLKSLREKSNG